MGGWLGSSCRHSWRSIRKASSDCCRCSSWPLLCVFPHGNGLNRWWRRCFGRRRRCYTCLHGGRRWCLRVQWTRMSPGPFCWRGGRLQASSRGTRLGNGTTSTCERGGSGSNGHPANWPGCCRVARSMRRRNAAPFLSLSCHGHGLAGDTGGVSIGIQKKNIQKLWKISFGMY